KICSLSSFHKPRPSGIVPEQQHSWGLPESLFVLGGWAIDRGSPDAGTMSSPHCSASKDRDTATPLPCTLCLEYVPRNT
ncbi:hypothetical protein QTP70_023667, partial [Hemibagrus guttatus]